MGRETLILRAALVALLMMMGVLAPAVSGVVCPVTLARPHTPPPASLPAVTECEGTACAQVSLTFDDAKQQYRARNSSTELWVRVSASNTAASASLCLAPGQESYLALKSITGPYRADSAQARCGEPGPEGSAPPASGGAARNRFEFHSGLRASTYGG